MFRPFCSIVVAAAALGVLALGGISRAEEDPYLTTKTPVTLLSANDGEFVYQRDENGKAGTVQFVKDSITVVHLGPDHPPQVVTVFGTVPNTVWGAPYMAITGDGRYGFVTNNSDRIGAPFLESLESPEGEPVTNQDLKPEDLSRQKLSCRLSNMVSVIDLTSPKLTVVKRFLFDEETWNAVPHPDGRRVLVGCMHSIKEFVVEDGVAKMLRSHRSPVNIDSFALSPKADWIITHGFHRNAAGDPVTNGIHAFKYFGDEIRYVCEVKVKPGVDATISEPFAPRFSPDGKRALTLNGWGLPGKGVLDDVLSIDLTNETPVVDEVVSQVGDGLESLAFHPSGRIAVVTCLDFLSFAMPGEGGSLAVIDLTTKPARLLYHVRLDGMPQGIEFSPEGDKLFVGVQANRIAVFDVKGFRLQPHPFFIKTGHGHASMAIAPRFHRARYRHRN